MFTFGRDKESLGFSTYVRYTLAVAFFILSLIVYVYPSIKATSLTYEYSSEYTRLKSIEEKNKTLRLRLATMRSYDFIERRAVKNMGFTYPAKGQVVIIAKK